MNENTQPVPKNTNQIVSKVVVGLVLLCLVFLCAVGGLLYVFRDWPNLAKVAFTRKESVELVLLVNARATNHALIPLNTNGGFLLHLLEPDEKRNLELDTSRRICKIITNAEGELLDGWAMPYRIEIIFQTNCVIRSAGKNRTFGDKDDIIFDSLKNRFVKP